ncbi:hypothetical protein VTJ49DRAFT_6553 [Mycothermus thermophilus]|uniref:F-box domain-containing protein n=1 Tax=Humicola insolens TaxID=85995 RepID=A0ABR3VIS5_HUMIN
MKPRQEHPQKEDDDLLPRQDTTQNLELRSKRTERQRRKREKKAGSLTRAASDTQLLLGLPVELLTAILELLRPSDLLALARTSRVLHGFIFANEADLARRVIRLRYPILEQCFLRPVLMRDIDAAIQPLLQGSYRADLAGIQQWPFARISIPSPDYALHCTCLTCLGRWNALCVVVDFAHWQDVLDNGEPIPDIAPGTSPKWNQDLLARTRRIVLAALTSPLRYARLLEVHLESTRRSVLRHSRNKTDRRPHYRMTTDMAETDAFLGQKGPPTVEFPYSREVYYLLEAFLPTRSWLTSQQRWGYIQRPDEWHQLDLDLLVRMVSLNRASQDAHVDQDSAATEGNRRC